MPKFDVVILRPDSLLGSEGYKSLQDLQYVAMGISATAVRYAGIAAIAECREDCPEQPASEFTILGTIHKGVYTPWLNGNYP